jgi:hypothetical protein
VFGKSEAPIIQILSKMNLRYFVDLFHFFCCILVFEFLLNFNSLLKKKKVDIDFVFLH